MNFQLLDIIKEIHNLFPIIFFPGDLLKANDELSRVMGRYKLVVEGTKMETIGNFSSNTAMASSNRKDSSHDDGEILLDLSTPEETPSTQTSTSLINRNLEGIGIVGEKINLNLSSDFFSSVIFSNWFHEN